MLATTGAAVFGLSTFPFSWTAAAEKKKQKVLYFTRSAGFEHGAVKRDGDQLAFSETALIEMGDRAGFDVHCTKDGRVFDGDLEQYDLIAFYTSGNLTSEKSADGGHPVSEAGKRKLLDTIAAGKGFVGFHAATDTCQRGPNEIDPYIAMLGGEFVSHGPQQVATVTVTSPDFPGIGDAKSLTMNEEWYALEKFADDLHVILVQETEGMQGDCYQRPPFPATWARMHNKGRVFYTSFGHRDDVWNNPDVQSIMLGGMAWAMRNVDADISPNLAQVTPQANQLTR
jgi:type 1 glutamine amidotransferase